MLALAPAVHHPGPHPSAASTSRAPSSRTLSPPKRLPAHRLPPPAQVYPPSSSTTTPLPPPIAATRSSSAPSAASPSPSPALRAAAPAPSAIDIASFPSSDLLRLLAQLLNRIATANDKIYHHAASTSSSRHSRAYSFDETSNEPPPPPQQDTPLYASLTTASRSSVASQTSPLFFHARNVPTISIESYLLRILKYCPTTNEVFLSLLVYFDRMSKLGEAIQNEWETVHSATVDDANADGVMSSPLIIDSYNIHRLIIAGVTVASKFFSDVFYTNSRYAKVGGLPTQELNKLELQFLLLNDFRLAIPPEELQLYFEQLLVNSSAPPTSPLPGLTPTSPGYELFGDASFSSVLYPPPCTTSRLPSRFQTTPPASMHAPQSSSGNGSYEPSVPPPSSTASSVAPTPSTVASTVSIDGVASSSSASTITQSTFARPFDGLEYTIPTNDERAWDGMAADADTPAAMSSAAVSETGTEVGDDDDDPTIRIYRQELLDAFTAAAEADDDEDEDEEDSGRRTPNRLLVTHSQYSSYTNTDFGGGEEEDDVHGKRRDESPAASLRYVNGHWDRGSTALEKEREKRYVGVDGEDDDPANVTEDEVVYRGVTTTRGRSDGSASARTSS